MPITETTCPLTGDRVVTASGREIQELRGAFRETSEADAAAKRARDIANPGRLMKTKRGKTVQVNAERAESMAAKRSGDVAEVRPCVVMPANFNPDPREVEAAREAARKRRS